MLYQETAAMHLPSPVGMAVPSPSSNLPAKDAASKAARQLFDSELSEKPSGETDNGDKQRQPSPADQPKKEASYEAALQLFVQQGPATSDKPVPPDESDNGDNKQLQKSPPNLPAKEVASKAAGQLFDPLEGTSADRHKASTANQPTKVSDSGEIKPPDETNNGDKQLHRRTERKDDNAADSSNTRKRGKKRQVQCRLPTNQLRITSLSLQRSNSRTSGVLGAETQDSDAELRSSVSNSTSDEDQEQWTPPGGKAKMKTRRTASREDRLPCELGIDCHCHHYSKAEMLALLPRADHLKLIYFGKCYVACALTIHEVVI